VDKAYEALGEPEYAEYSNSRHQCPAHCKHRHDLESNAMLYFVDKDGSVDYANDQARRTPVCEEAELTRTVVTDSDRDWGGDEWLRNCPDPRDNAVVRIDRLHESYEALRELMILRETAREDERKRIAREIHDELGQQLTALRMGISTLQILFAPENPALKEHIHKMLFITDRTMQVVREVMTSLRPAAIDAGIVGALEWLAAKCSRDGTFVCHLHLPDCEIEVDEAQATALFRIAQEALTNIVRHADAREVTVELRQVGEYFILEVHDDGSGFDPVAVPRNSFGLAGMRERVVILSGEITVESSRGNGTVIKVRLPVR
jgi:signal transduction histidine kinase